MGNCQNNIHCKAAEKKKKTDARKYLTSFMRSDVRTLAKGKKREKKRGRKRGSGGGKEK